MGSERPSVVLSAPGKVLLAGGYLVLDRAFTGLVFGLNARIHVHVQSLEAAENGALPDILVRSPQFSDAVWRYKYHENSSQGGIKVEQLNDQEESPTPRNRFVETALEFALTYALYGNDRKFTPAHVTILADSDYYSRPSTSDKTAESPHDRFIHFGVPIHKAHKTGLGSSAALVTALTAAVTAHYVPKDRLDVLSNEGRRRMHNLAQAAHCAAQGKVGSGFDVAAAAFGSCVYRRFSPSILNDLGDQGSLDFALRLKVLVNDEGSSGKWDYKIDKDPAKLPPGLILLMCDVDCGSETVGMVKQVLTWRAKDQQDADRLWTSLQNANEELASQFLRLSRRQGDTGVSPDYRDLRQRLATIRELLREMSAKTNVPIEPDVSTELIDRCAEVPGVIGGVVPGAGGFDAAVLLVENKAETIRELAGMLQSYQGKKGSSDQRIHNARLLGVKQENEGLQEEQLDSYLQWTGRSST